MRHPATTDPDRRLFLWVRKPKNLDLSASKQAELDAVFREYQDARDEYVRFLLFVGMYAVLAVLLLAVLVMGLVA